MQEAADQDKAESNSNSNKYLLSGSSNKESLFAKLLTPTETKQSTRVLIQEVDGDDSEDDQVVVDDQVVEVIEAAADADVVTEVDQGPTIMEMMMTAQKEAADVKKKVTAALEAEEAKKFGSGGGFKKGFFGSSGSKAKKDVKPKSTTEKEGPIHVTKKKEEKKVEKVYEEVQQAMKEDEHPMINHLKSNGK